MLFNEIMQRLKVVIKEDLKKENIIDKDIAKVLDINQSTFAVMKKRNKIPFEQIMAYCAKQKVSINWVFYNQSLESLYSKSLEIINIKYYSDIRASAGGGAENDIEEEEYISIDSLLLDNLIPSYDIKHLEAIRVTGDSMEPTLSDSDIILLNRANNSVTKEGIYVLRSENGVLVKRVLALTNGELMIISDNSIYPPERVKANSVEIIGKVIGSIGQVG
jgi:phage repressor protein C with HTH and peptisase S24 domain